MQGLPLLLHVEIRPGASEVPVVPDCTPVFHRIAARVSRLCFGPSCIIISNMTAASVQAVPDAETRTAEQCLQVLEAQLQTAHTAAQLAYAGTSNGGSEDTSRELERSPSDTSLDCESPRPPPSGAGAGLGRAWTPEDVVGSCRTTVLRGESDVTRPSLSIVGCHEACVYVLAPMKHVLVSCCADCVIVVRFLPWFLFTHFGCLESNFVAVVYVPVGSQLRTEFVRRATSTVSLLPIHFFLV